MKNKKLLKIIKEGKKKIAEGEAIWMDLEGNVYDSGDALRESLINDATTDNLASLIDDVVKQIAEELGPEPEEELEEGFALAASVKKDLGKLIK